MSNVVPMVGDNCSVIQKLSTIKFIPLVVSASHKRNLAVDNCINETPGLSNALDSVDHLMSKLRTLKNSSKLRSLTHLGATEPLETRWSAKFDMLRRVFRI